MSYRHRPYDRLPTLATYSLLGLMIVFLAMSILEILIGTMSISRYGVMTVYRVIIMDLMSDIVWLIVLA